MSHPQKTILNLLNNLPEKQKEIIAKRFGFLGHERQTLEAIGDQYGITRERVRQIEKDALSKLQKTDAKAQLAEHIEAIEKHITRHGHVRKEDELFERDHKEIFEGHKFRPPTGEFANPPVGGQAKPSIHLLLTLGSQFEKYPETDVWHTFWTTNPKLVPEIKSATQALEEKLKNHGKPVNKEELLRFAVETAKEKNLPSDEKALMSYAGISKNIGSNIFGQYGLNHWPQINPRGMRDKAFLAMQMAGKPLHFTQVATEIEKSGLTKKRAHRQTVHNELIKDKRFVLVGRGTYALSDWGYVPGTIKDVIAHILSQTQKPLTKEEISLAVLKQRQVKENTILLNLQNRKLFKKTDEGYILA